MKWIDKYLEESILLVLLVAMTCIMGVQVVARYVFSSSLSWSEESVRFMFVWSGFLGIPLCIKHGSSIAVEMVKIRMPAGIQKAMDYFMYLFSLALFALLLYYGWQTAAATYHIGQTSPALGIPMYWVQASVPISSFLALVRTVQCILTRNSGTHADLKDNILEGYITK